MELMESSGDGAIFSIVYCKGNGYVCGSKVKQMPFVLLSLTLLKGQCHEIFCFWFFSWISFPHPQSIPLGPFQIFLKIRGDIRKSRCTTSINDTDGKFCHQFH